MDVIQENDGVDTTNEDLNPKINEMVLLIILLMEWYYLLYYLWNGITYYITYITYHCILPIIYSPMYLFLI